MSVNYVLVNLISVATLNLKYRIEFILFKIIKILLRMNVITLKNKLLYTDLYF